MQYCLEMKNITKKFNTLKALDNADFRLKTGEVHALLGINGAGKSTLIKVLSGVHKRDGGEINVFGDIIDIDSPKKAIEVGISTVYQDPQMIESYTGYENIYLGNESSRSGIFSRINRQQLKRDAEMLLEKYPLDIDVSKPVYMLSSIEREILAVLRALSKDCKILILDEPTSILTDKEKHILFDVVRLLKSRGVSIIYITHHLDEVKEICDRFTVFRNGKNVKEVEIINKQVDPNYIAELMLGEKLEALYPTKIRNTHELPSYIAKDISLEGKLDSVSLEAYRGEILGIFGLVGSGIDELSKILFGAMDCDSGQVTKDGELVNLSDTRAVINQGIYLVPGNRKTEGQIGTLSIRKNVTISKLSRILSSKGLIFENKERNLVEEMVEELSIATTSIEKNVNQLSGGNQQKVVIAKSLFTEADVYIFAEPTVGVDVGAKFAIYQIMRELAKDSVVIIISSDPEEVLGNSDRIMVLHRGRVALKSVDSETSVNQMLVHAVASVEKEKGNV